MQTVAREVEHARAARQVVARPALGLDHQRVSAVPAAEHRPHLAQDVRRIDLVDLEQRQDGALLVRQGDLARVPSHDLCTAGHGKRIVGFPARPVIWTLRILEALRLSPLYKWVYETACEDSFVSIEKAQRVLGYDSLQTGLTFLPATLTMGALSLGLAAWIVARVR